MTIKTQHEKLLQQLYQGIETIPDFPQPGILFRDVTSLLGKIKLFNIAIELMLQPLRQLPIDKIVAIESRGFIFGASISQALNVGLVLARKPGKLPRRCLTEEYQLEYGSNSLQIHQDDIKAGENVVIIDDLIATGGTAKAAAKLVASLQGKLQAYSFLIELKGLSGRKILTDAPIYSVLKYD